MLQGSELDLAGLGGSPFVVSAVLNLQIKLLESQ
jgi:hypothetical protein